MIGVSANFMENISWFFLNIYLPWHSNCFKFNFRLSSKKKKLSFNNLLYFNNSLDFSYRPTLIFVQTILHLLLVIWLFLPSFMKFNYSKLQLYDLISPIFHRFLFNCVVCYRTKFVYVLDKLKVSYLTGYKKGWKMRWWIW